MVTFTNYFLPNFISGSDKVLKRKNYDGLSKLYRYFFEYELDSRVGSSDVWLWCSFVVLFVVALVLLARLLFKEEQMPLDDIREKAESSDLELTNLANTLRVIKGANYRSLTYEDYTQIKKNKDSALRVLELTKETEPPEPEPQEPEPQEPKPQEPEPQEPEPQEPVAAVAPKTSKVKTVRSTTPNLKKSPARRIGILRQITPPTTEPARFDSSPSLKKSNLLCRSRASDAGNPQKAQRSVISVNIKPKVKVAQKS